MTPVDQTAYVVISQWGMVSFYTSEEQMLDNVRRTDRAYSVRLSDWKELRDAG